MNTTRVITNRRPISKTDNGRFFIRRGRLVGIDSQLTRVIISSRGGITDVNRLTRGLGGRHFNFLVSSSGKFVGTGSVNFLNRNANRGCPLLLPPERHPSKAVLGVRRASPVGNLLYRLPASNQGTIRPTHFFRPTRRCRVPRHNQGNPIGLQSLKRVNGTVRLINRRVFTVNGPPHSRKGRPRRNLGRHAFANSIKTGRPRRVTEPRHRISITRNLNVTVISARIVSYSF